MSLSLPDRICPRFPNHLFLSSISESFSRSLIPPHPHPNLSKLISDHPHLPAPTHAFPVCVSASVALACFYLFSPAPFSSVSPGPALSPITDPTVPALWPSVWSSLRGQHTFRATTPFCSASSLGPQPSTATHARQRPLALLTRDTEPTLVGSPAPASPHLASPAGEGRGPRRRRLGGGRRRLSTCLASQLQEG